MSMKSDVVEEVGGWLHERDARGRSVSVTLPWSAVREILGREHTGSAEQDCELVAWLVRMGAPVWITGPESEGTIDQPTVEQEGGWTLVRRPRRGGVSL